MSFRQLSPWDSFKFFEKPRVTTSVLSAGQPIQIASSDPRRVAIYFAVGPIVTGIMISPDKTKVMSGGFFLNAANPWIGFFHQRDGALCQYEWWANPDGGSTLTIVEQLLRDWPEATGE